MRTMLMRVLLSDPLKIAETLAEPNALAERSRNLKVTREWSPNAEESRGSASRTTFRPRLAFSVTHPLVRLHRRHSRPAKSGCEPRTAKDVPCSRTSSAMFKSNARNHYERNAVNRHHPGLLVECHPAHKVADTFIGGQAPVLVGLEFAVAIRVLETIATVRQHRLGPSLDMRCIPATHTTSTSQRRECKSKHEQSEPPGQRRKGSVISVGSRAAIVDLAGTKKREYR